MSDLNVEIKRTPTNGIYIYSDGVKVAKTDYSKESERFVAWLEQCKANEDRNEVVTALHKQNVVFSEERAEVCDTIKHRMMEAGIYKKCVDCGEEFKEQT